MLVAAKWVERIGYRGAPLRRTYLLWRVLPVVAIPAFWLGDAGLAALNLNVSETTATVLIVVSALLMTGVIIWAQGITQRNMVTEILRNAHLPLMKINDRSIGTIAGYDNWIGRVGSLARPAL
jgi:hypothetical protein